MSLEKGGDVRGPTSAGLNAFIGTMLLKLQQFGNACATLDYGGITPSTFVSIPRTTFISTQLVQKRRSLQLTFAFRRGDPSPYEYVADALGTGKQSQSGAGRGENR